MSQLQVILAGLKEPSIQTSHAEQCCGVEYIAFTDLVCLK